MSMENFGGSQTLTYSKNLTCTIWISLSIIKKHRNKRKSGDTQHHILQDSLWRVPLFDYEKCTKTDQDDSIPDHKTYMHSDNTTLDVSDYSFSVKLDLGNK